MTYNSREEMPLFKSWGFERVWRWRALHGGWRVWVEEMMKYGGAVMLDIYYACEFIENPWRKVLEQNKFRQKMERLNNKLKLNKEIAEHK